MLSPLKILLLKWVCFHFCGFHVNQNFCMCWYFWRRLFGIYLESWSCSTSLVFSKPEAKVLPDRLVVECCFQQYPATWRGVGEPLRSNVRFHVKGHSSDPHLGTTCEAHFCCTPSVMMLRVYCCLKWCKTMFTHSPSNMVAGDTRNGPHQTHGTGETLARFHEITNLINLCLSQSNHDLIMTPSNFPQMSEASLTRKYQSDQRMSNAFFTKLIFLWLTTILESKLCDQTRLLKNMKAKLAQQN